MSNNSPVSQGAQGKEYYSFQSGIGWSIEIDKTAASAGRIQGK
jgi:hypothetical protein